MIERPQFSPLDKIRVHFNGLPFKPSENQIIFYDPLKQSEFSDYVENNLHEIKDFFKEIGFEFCYFPEIFSQLTPEQVRYHFPNWDGEPLRQVGNDLLKPYLATEDRDIGACFLRLFDKYDDTFSCYQLKPLLRMKWEDQLSYYKSGLLRARDKETSDTVMFSITCRENDESTIYGDSMSFAKRFLFDIDADFEQESGKILEELKDFIKSVRLQGIKEFVLSCSVPVERRLSRLVVDENYNIILPDYGNMIIKMDLMPKAVFLLFLRHEEGISFKALINYRKELEGYYKALTNHFASKTVEDRVDAVVDSTKNTLNEKCSRIREAFLKQMDQSLADYYCITGQRGEAKRITLPRSLVEWRCKI